MPHLNRNVHHEYSAPENVRRRDRRRLRMRVCSQFHGCFDSRSGDWKTRVESGLADKEHHRQYLADFPGVRLLKEPRCEIDGTAGWRRRNTGRFKDHHRSGALWNQCYHCDHRSEYARRAGCLACLPGNISGTAGFGSFRFNSASDQDRNAGKQNCRSGCRRKTKCLS